jgi:ATP-dependent DNA helicase RecQ
MQRRISQQGASGKRQAVLEESLRAVAGYAATWTCRQRVLCAHFTGTDDHPACGLCDACRDPAGEAPRVEPPPSVLGSVEQEIILAALAAHGRPTGKGNLAKALRGSHAKPVVVHGLDRLAQHGALAACSEADIGATIETLIRERRLVRRGRKYPTVALPGSARPRAPRARLPGATNARRGRDGSPTSSITVELDRFRKQRARQLRWKVYMVLPRSVVTAIDAARPDSLAALARIPGLGPQRIARFGDELLAIVRRYGSRSAAPVEPAVRDLFSQLAREP